MEVNPIRNVRMYRIVKTFFLSVECRHKNEDYQQLAQQLHTLETRLNNTVEENIDLRATIDLLQTEDPITEGNTC